MSRHLKITALALTLAGFAAMAGAYQLGFELWPPSAILADGTSTRFRPTEVQACFKARALAWAGDRGGDASWQGRQQLIAYQALGAFDFRHHGGDGRRSDRSPGEAKRPPIPREPSLPRRGVNQGSLIGQGSDCSCRCVRASGTVLYCARRPSCAISRAVSHVRKRIGHLEATL
jgi:hypothetical protein